MKQVDLLNKAVSLRKKGFSLCEISEQLNISKSTASLWLRDIKIGKEAAKRLAELGFKGRAKSIIANKKRRQVAWQKMADNSVIINKKLSNYDVDYCKILLAMLYWGEGAKTGRQLVFMNSDPEMIKMYLFLLRKVFVVNENKLKAYLHLHDYHNKSEMIDYWSNVAKINSSQIKIYNKPNTGIRKKPDYKGCISIRCYNSLILDEVFLIIKRLQQSIV